MCHAENVGANFLASKFQGAHGLARDPQQFLEAPSLRITTLLASVLASPRLIFENNMWLEKLTQETSPELQETMEILDPPCPQREGAKGMVDLYRIRLYSVEKGVSCRNTSLLNGECKRCNLPPAGGKWRRLFHSWMPDGRYPLPLNAGGATFLARGRQAAQAFPLNDAKQYSDTRFRPTPCCKKLICGIGRNVVRSMWDETRFNS